MSMCQAVLTGPSGRTCKRVCDPRKPRKIGVLTIRGAKSSMIPDTKRGRRRMEPYRDPQGRVCISAKDAAELLGVGVSSLANRTDLDFGYTEEGKKSGYVLQTVFERAVMRASKDSDRKRAKIDVSDTSDPRVRKAIAQAEKAELEVEAYRKTLVPIEDVYRDLSRAVAATQARLQQIPTKISPELEGLEAVEIEETLESTLREALEEIAAFKFGKEEKAEDA